MSRWRKLAAVGGAGVFPIPCGPWQRGEASNVSERRNAKVAASATATEPTEPLDLGTFLGTLRNLAPERLHPSPLSNRALRRQTSEVGTVCVSSASTGLCGGVPSNRHPYRDLGWRRILRGDGPRTRFIFRSRGWPTTSTVYEGPGGPRNFMKIADSQAIIQNGSERRD